MCARYVVRWAFFQNLFVHGRIFRRKNPTGGPLCCLSHAPLSFSRNAVLPYFRDRWTHHIVALLLFVFIDPPLAVVAKRPPVAPRRHHITVFIALSLIER